MMMTKAELAKKILDLQEMIADRDRQLEQIASAELSIPQIEEEIRRRVADALKGRPHLSQGPGFDWWVGECGHEWRRKDSLECPYCRIAALEGQSGGLER